MNARFWVLRGIDNERRLATREAGVYAPSIECPVEPGHLRAGKRIGDLVVQLPNGVSDDFIWTWHSDCLMQENVRGLFDKEHITGFSTRPVTFLRAGADDCKQPAPPRLSELVVTGWGGIAPESSGIRVDTQKSCGYCGYLQYSSFTNPSQIIDPRQWDGCDIFMVWPLPRFIFVTDRVAKIIRSNELTGVVLVAPEELVAHTSALAPGRLSYHMPKERAERFGGQFGIV